jgi:hypothetical protein
MILEKPKKKNGLMDGLSYSMKMNNGNDALNPSTD